MPGYGYIEINFQKSKGIYFRNEPITYLVSFYKADNSLEIKNAKLENGVLKAYVPYYYKEDKVYSVSVECFSTADDSLKSLKIDIVKNPEEARNKVHKNHETYEPELFYKNIFVTPHFNSNEFFFTERKVRGSVGS